MKRTPTCSISLLLAVCSLLVVNCSEDEPPRESPLTLETVQIPGGTFIMGSPITEANRKDDEGEREVTLSSFRMSKFEITNSEFAAFLNAEKVDRYGHHPKDDEPKAILVKLNTGWGVWYENNQWVPVTGYENHPVVDVTWFGAMAFAFWVGGRLPTEAEWEYACRGNTTTAFNTGACLTDAQGNYLWDHPYNTCPNTTSQSPNKPQAVGTYAANAFGLHDMHGNVWEWCIDSYGGNPDLRVLRGGSWSEEAWVCRSSNRHSMASVSWIANGTTGGNTGFRVVLE